MKLALLNLLPLRRHRPGHLPAVAILTIFMGTIFIGLCSSVPGSLAEPNRLTGEQIRQKLGGKLFQYCGRRSGSIELLNNGHVRAFDSTYGQIYGRWWVKGNQLCREWAKWPRLANCTAITVVADDDYLTDQGYEIFTYANRGRRANCSNRAATGKSVETLKKQPLPQSIAIAMLRRERDRLQRKYADPRNKANSKRLKRTKNRAGKKLNPAIWVRGKGKRIAVTQDYRAVKSLIGLLRFQNGSACTAFCIGKDLIATSAHCFFNTKTTKAKDGLAFTRFFLPDDTVSMTNDTKRQNYLRAIYGPKRSYIKGRNSQEAANNIVLGYRRFIRSSGRFRSDWALVRLSRPICENYLQISKLKLSKLISASKNGNISLIGYHGDRRYDGLLLTPNCKILNRNINAAGRTFLRSYLGLDKQTMLHSCRMASGSSGSPILVKNGDKFEVIAINAGFASWHRWRRKSRKARKRIVKRWSENIAVLAAPLKPLIDRLKTETLLTSEEEYRRLQEALNRAGFNVGSVDGVLGPRSKRAIKRFEKKKGKPPTGLPTRELLQAVEAAANR